MTPRRPVAVDRWLHRANSSDDSAGEFDGVRVPWRGRNTNARDLDAAAKMERCLSQMELANRDLERIPERLRTCASCGAELALVHCIQDGLPICADCLFKDKVCPSCGRVYHHSVRARACPVCRTKLAVRCNDCTKARSSGDGVAPDEVAGGDL